MLLLTILTALIMSAADRDVVAPPPETPRADGGAICLSSTSPDESPRFAKAFKGVELHSWKTPNDGFAYSVLWGTNRSKTADEIKSAACILTDLRALKAALSRLAEGESVSWINDNCPDKACAYPPHDVIKALRAHARAIGIDLFVEEPR